MFCHYFHLKYLQILVLIFIKSRNGFQVILGSLSYIYDLPSGFCFFLVDHQMKAHSPELFCISQSSSKCKMWFLHLCAKGIQGRRLIWITCIELLMSTRECMSVARRTKSVSCHKNTCQGHMMFVHWVFSISIPPLLCICSISIPPHQKYDLTWCGDPTSK